MYIEYFLYRYICMLHKKMGIEQEGNYLYMNIWMYMHMCMSYICINVYVHKCILIVFYIDICMC
jgi:high-affinity Fe2+/Pb2+ permease